MNDIKDFCYKYEAYVDESQHMHRRIKRMPFNMWSESDPEIFQTIPYEKVKCVVIHMPEDRFRALLEHDEWLENAGRQNQQYQFNDIHRASSIVKEHEREARIRHSNPSVQIAWEKYQNLLKLVDSHYD